MINTHPAFKSFSDSLGQEFVDSCSQRLFFPSKLPNMPESLRDIATRSNLELCSAYVDCVVEFCAVESARMSRLIELELKSEVRSGCSVSSIINEVSALLCDMDMLEYVSEKDWVSSKA